MFCEVRSQDGLRMYTHAALVGRPFLSALSVIVLTHCLRMHTHAALVGRPYLSAGSAAVEC